MEGAGDMQRAGYGSAVGGGLTAPGPEIPAGDQLPGTALAPPPWKLPRSVACKAEPESPLF